MEYLVHINALEIVPQLKTLGINNYVVGMEEFSCRQALSLNYTQLKKLKEDLPKQKLFVLCNALVEECNFEALKVHLKMLNDCNIDGLLFQDFGVLQIVSINQYKFKMIYSPDTLNTNYATLQVLGKKGISGAFLAREIPLVEKQKIASNVDIDTVVQVHGVEYMAYSKRNLLTNYFVNNGKIETTSYDDGITIKGQGIEDQCHIYEDKYGCHITTKRQIQTLDILDMLDCFTYGYIESLFLLPEHLVEVVKLYSNGVQDNSISTLKALDKTMTYGHSFLFDQTVYSLEDIRKREANENN